MINMQCILKDNYNDFPSGPVAVKDLLSNARDAGLFLCQRTLISHATEQLGLHVSKRVYTRQVMSLPSSNRESLPQGKMLHATLRPNTAKEMINKYTIE